MSSDDRVERIQQDLERLLHFVTEEGGAGGTVGPEGLHLGLPNWDERTKHLRPSERIRSHGYPFGFAKSQWYLRDQLLERLRRRIQSLSPEDLTGLSEVREALARALDWERLLGSFNHASGGDGDSFPLDQIDPVADHLIAWLGHQGFAIVRKEPREEDPLPEVESRFPRVFDNGRGLVVPVGVEDRGAFDVTNEEAEMTTDESDRTAGPEDMVDEDGGEDPVAEVDQVEDEEDEEDEDGEDDEPAVTCPSCEGAGCDRCHDNGYLTDSDIEEELGGGAVPCRWCEGTGQLGSFVMEQQCSGCAGLGQVTSERAAEFDGDTWKEWFSNVGQAKVAHDDHDLTNVDLARCDLSGEDLSHCDLSEQQLQGQDLSGTELEGANLSRARLDGATFTDANLTGADLVGASLQGAVLRGASLGDADLSQADLSGADLADTDVEEAASLEGTLLLDVVGLTKEQRLACLAKGAAVGEAE